MPNKPGTRLLSGSTTITTAQTAVQLVTTPGEFTCLGVWIAPDTGNTGKLIAVGGSKTTTEAKTKLTKGVVFWEKAAAIFFEVGDPSALWVDAETSGDKVCWTAVLA